MDSINNKTFEELLYKYLKKENVTKAVENALEEYNNCRDEKEGISIATAWRRYKKYKEKNKSEFF